ncbi:MAG TPA: hypothetical protein VJR89_38230, partial [Polyangiales bacterium]|nr:hypothetical protein [Polyangiales bacterium]
MRVFRFGTVALWILCSACSGMAPRAVPREPSRVLSAELSPRTEAVEQPDELIAPAPERAAEKTYELMPVPGPDEVVIFRAGEPAGVIPRG